MAHSPLRADSARANRYNQFRQALLAPLADTAEQVDDPAFRRAMRQDAEERWQAGMLRVRLTEHMRDAEHCRRLLLSRAQRRVILKADTACEIMERQHWQEVDRQMRIPAPHRRAIEWKKKAAPYLGGHPDWAGLIAGDEARIPAKPFRARKVVP